MIYHGDYNIVYADPPWTYKDKARAGKRGVEFKYPTMSIKDIVNLPVTNVTAKDAVLFLWVTFPLLTEGLITIKRWGFQYKTTGFVWIKTNKVSTDTLFMGMGNWTRSNSELCLLGLRGEYESLLVNDSELCLLGVKGKPKRISGGVHSVVVSPVSKHSRKPHEVRERIVDLMGDLPRLELFATEKHEGWDCVGYDLGLDVREFLTVGRGT